MMTYFIRSTKILTLALASVLTLSANAERQIRSIEKAEEFDNLDLSQLDINSIYFNTRLLPYSDWSTVAPQEQANLGLFPTYSEPTLFYKKGVFKKKRTEILQMFVNRIRFVVNRPANGINLKSLVSMESINKFMPKSESQQGDINHQIDASQVITKLVPNANLPSFRWCDSTGNMIFRPTKEIDLSPLDPPESSGRGPWCSNPENSTCFETCALVPNYLYNLMSTVNGLDSDPKDYGFASQAEARALTDEKSLGLTVPVQQLTRVNSAFTGAIEVNLFFVNQIVQYGKVLAVFQPSPTDPEQTIVTGFFVIGVKKRTWDQYEQVRQFLLGQPVKIPGTGGTVNLSEKRGFFAGLPAFTQDLLISMTKLLE